MGSKKADKLRKQLKDYYGTAMVSGFGAATENLRKIDKATDEEIEEIASENGIDISDDDCER